MTAPAESGLARESPPPVASPQRTPAPATKMKAETPPTRGETSPSPRIRSHRAERQQVALARSLLPARAPQPARITLSVTCTTHLFLQLIPLCDDMAHRLQQALRCVAHKARLILGALPCHRPQHALPHSKPHPIPRIPTSQSTLGSIAHGSFSPNPTRSPVVKSKMSPAHWT